MRFLTKRLKQQLLKLYAWRKEGRISAVKLMVRNGAVSERVVAFCESHGIEIIDDSFLNTGW